MIQENDTRMLWKDENVPDRSVFPEDRKAILRKRVSLLEHFQKGFLLEFANLDRWQNVTDFQKGMLWVRGYDSRLVGIR